MTVHMRWLIPGLLLCAADVLALDTSGYRYRRDILDVDSREELIAVTLDSVLWEALQEDAVDLRVMGSDDRVAPYLLRKALRTERQTAQVPCGSKMTAFRQLSDNQAEILLALETNAPAADGIVFDTPLKDFERRLSVWGLASDGTEQLLVEDALIYDYSRFVDVRHCSVALPANEARQFKVVVKTVTDEAQSPRHQIERTLEGGAEVRLKDQTVVTERPFRIDHVAFYHERKLENRRGESRAEYRPRSWMIREDERRKQTVIEIETFREPLTSFVLQTDARNFSRQASVEIPAREGGIETWRRVGQARLSRITFRDFVRQELEISFPEQRSERVRVVLDNLDSPPLAIAGVQGMGPVWQAVFLTEPATRFAVFYGGGQTAPVHYDTEHIQQILAREYEPAGCKLGPQVENQDYRRKTGGLGAWIGGRTFFIAVLVVMVGVLGFGLTRAARKMGAMGE